MKSKKRKSPQPVQNNYVAKYARQFNQAAVHTDRKKAIKKGYLKHKGQGYSQKAA